MKVQLFRLLKLYSMMLSAFGAEEHIIEKSQRIMVIQKRSKKQPRYFIIYVQFWRELRKSFRMMQKSGSNILS